MLHRSRYGYRGCNRSSVGDDCQDSVTVFRANGHVVINDHEGKVIRLTSKATVLMALHGNHPGLISSPDEQVAAEEKVDATQATRQGVSSLPTFEIIWQLDDKVR